MPQKITKQGALLSLARMMGKRRMPSGYIDDWDEYVQTAFNYAWRYYQWGWSLRSAAVDMSDPANIFLPADFDPDGFRKYIPNDNGMITELELTEWYARGQYGNTIALEYDPTTEQYKVHAGAGVGALTIVYQVTPPLLDDAGVFFPSSMTIGIGAAIYAKQGENPNRADITQEWDEFHKELDRHVARSDKNKPRQLIQNIQDAYGTYTGNVEGW